MKSGEFPTEQAIPVCSTPASINAGFELLVALAVGCVRNLKQIVDTLTDMYYLGKGMVGLVGHFKLNFVPEGQLVIQQYPHSPISQK